MWWISCPAWKTIKILNAVCVLSLLFHNVLKPGGVQRLRREQRCFAMIKRNTIDSRWNQLLHDWKFLAVQKFGESSSSCVVIISLKLVFSFTLKYSEVATSGFAFSLLSASWHKLMLKLHRNKWRVLTETAVTIAGRFPLRAGVPPRGRLSETALRRVELYK